MFSLSLARTRAIAFASSAAFALVLASSLAAANGVDSDQDGVSDGLEDATERTVAASASGDEFNVSSHLSSGDLRDEFDLSYSAGRLEVSYGQKDGPGTSYRLELRSLIAWTDRNVNGTIDPEGEIEGEASLGSSAFGGVSVVRSNRTDSDGGRVFNFLIRSPAVTLNVTVARRFMRYGDVVLTPMEAKMDITMNPLVGYPGSSVGFVMRIETEDDVRFEEQSWDQVNRFAQSERAVNVTRREGERSASVFFSWANSASAGGASIPVTLSNRGQVGGTHDLYFGYPLGPRQSSASVVHHTALGVQSVVFEKVEASTPEIQGDLPLYTGTFAAVAAVVALTFVIANRRRRRRRD